MIRRFFRNVRLLLALPIPVPFSLWRILTVAATFSNEDIEALVHEAEDLRTVTNEIIAAGQAVQDAEEDVADAETALSTAEAVLTTRQQDKQDLEVQATAQVDFLGEWIDYFKGNGPRPTNDPTPNGPTV